ncbi:MAG TPA: hypothetical protein PLC65_16615, partial [Bacteroidia bacterium]|nr:hypothetical protein [Bacteroidia bacterium]
MLNSVKIEKKTGGWGNTSSITSSSVTENAALDKRKRMLRWLFVIVLLFGYIVATMAQTGMNDINFQAESEFQPTIKDAIKFADVPEI